MLARYVEHSPEIFVMLFYSNCLQFKCGEERCSQPAVGGDFCEEHESLRVKSHSFYKTAEAQYNRVRPDGSDEYLFEQRHRFLLAAVSARIVHAELFFWDTPCNGHAVYGADLCWKMHQEEALMAMRGLGFIVQGASYNDMLSIAKASLKQAFLDWSQSDKSKHELYDIVDQRKADMQL